MSKLKKALEERDYLKAKRLILDNPKYLEENVDLLIGVIKDYSTVHSHVSEKKEYGYYINKKTGDINLFIKNPGEDWENYDPDRVDWSDGAVNAKYRFCYMDEQLSNNKDEDKKPAVIKIAETGEVVCRIEDTRVNERFVSGYAFRRGEMIDGHTMIADDAEIDFSRMDMTSTWHDKDRAHEEAIKENEDRYERDRPYYFPKISEEFKQQLRDSLADDEKLEKLKKSIAGKPHPLDDNWVECNLDESIPTLSGMKKGDDETLAFDAKKHTHLIPFEEHPIFKFEKPICSKCSKEVDYWGLLYDINRGATRLVGVECHGEIDDCAILPHDQCEDDMGYYSDGKKYIDFDAIPKEIKPGDVRRIFWNFFEKQPTEWTGGTLVQRGVRDSLTKMLRENKKKLDGKGAK